MDQKCFQCILISSETIFPRSIFLMQPLYSLTALDPWCTPHHYWHYSQVEALRYYIALGHSLAAFKQSLTICLQNPFYQSYCIYNNTTITTLCKNSFGCTTTRSQSSAVKAAEFECRLVETKHKYYCDVWLEKENAININSFLVDQNVSTCTSINQFSDEPVRKWWKIFKFT